MECLILKKIDLFNNRQVKHRCNKAFENSKIQKKPFFSIFYVATTPQQGIELHDKGDFQGAISKYEQALKIDKKSTLANYEIALSYNAMKDYENAMKYSKIIIDIDKDNLLPAYMIYSAALDNMGKPKESIKVYTKAVKKFPDSYLLYYNLALSNYNYKDYKEAELALYKAIERNPLHGSSHFLLGYLMSEQNRRVQSLLPIYFVLMLEPTSARAKGAYQTLQQLLNQGVSQKSDKETNITLDIGTLGEKNEFSAAELMLSMLSASKSLEKNKDKTEMELFVDNTEAFFSILGELNKDKKGIWWEFYINFFYAMTQAKHTVPFCYYISMADPKKKAKHGWRIIK